MILARVGGEVQSPGALSLAPLKCFGPRMVLRASGCLSSLPEPLSSRYALAASKRRVSSRKAAKITSMTLPNSRCSCACMACAHGPTADKSCDATITVSVTLVNGSACRSLVWETVAISVRAVSSSYMIFSLSLRPSFSLFLLTVSRRQHRLPANRSVAFRSFLSWQLISTALRPVRMH